MVSRPKKKKEKSLAQNYPDETGSISFISFLGKSRWDQEITLSDSEADIIFKWTFSDFYI